MLLISGLVIILATEILANDVFSADVACSTVFKSLGPSFVQFNGSQYEAAVNGTWNLLNEYSRPICIIFPTNTQHVEISMSAIYVSGARYSVQAGGHSAMEGWDTVQNGVLILFSKMKDLTYDATSNTITLQPGVLWDEAVSMLAPLGVAPVGGRQGNVGTGLLLGGGLSFLSPEYGFAADNIKEVDVVLVNGTLVTANANNEYADLFRALKGGGSRFGIVTQYRLFAVHTGTDAEMNWFGGSITYDSSSVQAILNATANYVAHVNDPKAVLLVSVVDVITNGTFSLSVIAANIFYHGNSLPPSVFSNFLSIPSLQNSLGPLSYEGVSSLLPADYGRGIAQHYGASALVGDAQLYLDGLAHYNNFTKTFADQLSMGVFAFTPVLQPQIDVGRKRGGNAIDPPDGGYAAVQISHQLAIGTTKISPELQMGFDLVFKQVPRSPGKPLFLNECDRYQNVYETYSDYDFLKKTYAKYDPTRYNVQHMEGPVGL